MIIVKFILHHVKTEISIEFAMRLFLSFSFDFRSFDIRGAIYSVYARYIIRLTRMAKKSSSLVNLLIFDEIAIGLSLGVWVNFAF